MRNEVIFEEYEEYVFDQSKVLFNSDGRCVYLCRHINDQTPNFYVEIKDVDLDNPKVQKRIKILKKLIHASEKNPNIVKIHGLGIKNDKIQIVYESCAETLQNQINQKNVNRQKFSAVQALNIIKQIINGYQPLYINKHIHKNIEPSNIIFKNGKYKLSIVGLELDNKSTHDYFSNSSLHYASPDVIHNITLSNSADIYSIGVIFYELICGWRPYKVQSFADAEKATKAIQNSPIRIDLENKNSYLIQQICNLIESMLLFSQEQRITWTQLINHPLIINAYVEYDQIQLPSTFYDDESDQSSVEFIDNISTQELTYPTDPEDNQFQIFDEKQETFLPEAEFNKLQIPQFQDINDNPIQAIIKLIVFFDLSDQFYNFAIFHQCIYVLFGNYKITLLLVQNEILEIKFLLHCLVSCFFEICKSKNKNMNQSEINIMENQVALNLIRQELQEEIQRMNCTQQYQIEPILNEFQFYQTKLLKSYQNIRKKLKYQNNEEDAEFISLLFIMERMYENGLQIKNSINLCFFIQEIDILKVETMKKYLDTKEYN